MIYIYFLAVINATISIGMPDNLGDEPMKFPDPNIGYIFGYKSYVTAQGILITFINGKIKIEFKYSDIKQIFREVYSGGRISWNIIRWGKCPSGTEALKIILNRGMYRNHFIVFDNIENAIDDLKNHGIDVE